MKIEKLYKEQWIPIQGFEDSYAVSSHGRIKSLARTRPFGPRFKTYSEVLKKIRSKTNKRLGANPYNYVSLSRPVDGKTFTRQYPVARLVAKHFYPEKWHPDLTVDHLNGDTLNDHMDNLEPITMIENIRRKFRDSGPRGCTRSKNKKRFTSKLFNGKKGNFIYVGTFDTEAEAHKAFFKKYVEVYGVEPWEVDSNGDWLGTKYKMENK